MCPPSCPAHLSLTLLQQHRASLDAVAGAVATHPVGWPEVSVACGGAFVVDAGPGAVSGFGMDDACLRRLFPRTEYACCEDFRRDPARNPTAVCLHCGGYTRRGASFSLGAMLSARRSLADLNSDFFTAYDPVADALVDERGAFFTPSSSV